MNDLPKDLGKPRNPHRTAFIAAVVTAGILLALDIGLVILAAVTP